MPKYLEAEALEKQDWLLVKTDGWNKAYYMKPTEAPAADEEKIATEYCMKRGLVMITIDTYETLVAYYNRVNELWTDT